VVSAALSHLTSRKCLGLDVANLIIFISKMAKLPKTTKFSLLKKKLPKKHCLAFSFDEWARTKDWVMPREYTHVERVLS
jgi:hypothetical protein